MPTGGTLSGGAGWGPTHWVGGLLDFFVVRMTPAPLAVFPQLKPFGYRLLVLHGSVVPALAFGALEGDYVLHADAQTSLRWWEETSSSSPEIYWIISVTVPAPTVRPPSRMANRNPFSIAMGVISSPVNDTLSPGITISVPSGRFTTPVTSVVRK